MKSKIVVILAVLLSLTFNAPNAIHVDQPTFTTFVQNGGA
ncbi:hypothetical protein SAMN02744124_01714 [Paenibacillus barengoltzii J12]|jgi:hypothetical protein|uniref:Uncharacterized protein n=1 Tax=Paenibacillus barengoltzii J12 TaxID=935846 RepID=A0ABY1LW88_9BACL|nr:hypothetical protein SAMN02744124_01714 [Paenibacillus barengoltzii J12]